MNFRKALLSTISAAILIVVCAGAIYAEEKATTVKGYVLDAACAFVRNVKKPRGEDCALKCAKAGSPLVILTEDGTIYWPISSEMPATGQNQRLMEFAGKMVTASGKVFERGGSHAIVIEKIEAAPAGK